MDNQEQFARMMEEAIKNALAATDAAMAQVQAEREAVLAEREAAHEERRAIERNADKLAADYFEQRRTELVEFARTELLRRLARRHLEAGESSEAIERWLDVTPDFVSAIAEVVDRVAAFRQTQAAAEGRSVPTGNPKVRYENQGRGGTVWYESAEARFALWWEFAGGEALAIIEAPDADHWETRTGLPRDRRDEVLRFIGERAVAEQTGGRGSFLIGESVLTIFS